MNLVSAFPPAQFGGLLRDLAAIAREADGQVTDPMREKLAELIARPDLLTAGVDRDSAHGRATGWLYYDTEVAISMGGTYVKPVPAHDHGTWQIFCVYQGSLEYIGYRHDSSTDDFHSDTHLEVTDNRRLEVGDIALVGQPPEDVHEWLPLEEDTYLVGIYPAPFSKTRRYFKGMGLGRSLPHGHQEPRRMFVKPEGKS